MEAEVRGLQGLWLLARNPVRYVLGPCNCWRMDLLSSLKKVGMRRLLLESAISLDQRLGENPLTAP